MKFFRFLTLIIANNSNIEIRRKNQLLLKYLDLSEKIWDFLWI